MNVGTDGCRVEGYMVGIDIDGEVEKAIEEWSLGYCPSGKLYHELYAELVALVYMFGAEGLEIAGRLLEFGGNCHE